MVRVPGPPDRAGQSAAAGVQPPPLARRNPRERLTITVSYRGGAECYWEIRARGRVYRRAGSLALHDVLIEITDGDPGKYC